MSVRLFIGNLSYDVTEADLRGLFSEVGAVGQVRMPVDRESGRPRGFAFVDFAERAEAEAAITRFDQYTLQGRALAVSEAVAREDAPRRDGSGGGGRPPFAGGGPPPGGPGGDRGPGAPGPPTRSFGPDAAPRSRRKPEGRGQNAGPRGPIKVRAAPRSSGGLTDEDLEADDVPFWAVADDEDDDTT